MRNDDDNVRRLRERLEALIRRQGEISSEMYAIKDEIDSLSQPAHSESEPPKEQLAVPTAPRELEPRPPAAGEEPPPPKKIESFDYAGPLPERETPPVSRISPELERWIGENLISKIGIVITILGVAIGAKYAIDKGWITPVMRIVFGYAVGAGLLIAALRLKDKYERFSAVLISGAMAIFYFISFAAYSYYALFPQALAFILMAAFTAFTVLAATSYNRVVIAHIGLIGAYATPFLLSEESGRYAFLFSYVAIINAGILTLSIFRYWRSLFYPSFLITWAIFALWYVSQYDPAEYLYLGMGFSGAFFAIFYTTFIAYKLRTGAGFAVENVLLVLANAFVFYGFVYSMASGDEALTAYLGPITIANGALHLAVAAAVHRFASADKTVISLLVALVITFVTIAIPVQMDGNTVVLLWAVEAAALFAIARFRAVPLFEWFSYPLVFMAAVGLYLQWLETWLDGPDRTLLNPVFLTAMIFAAALAAILYSDSARSEGSVLPAPLSTAARFALGALLVFIVYNALRLEISNYWRQESLISRQMMAEDYSSWDPYPPLMNIIWQINFSMAFFAALWLLNEKLLKSRWLRHSSAALGVLSVAVFLAFGIPVLGSLREAYLEIEPSVPSHGAGGIIVRYPAYALAALVLAYVGRSVARIGRDDPVTGIALRTAFDLFVHLTVLIVLGAELFTWMDITGIADSGKLALSILWGLYAVLMLTIGISRKKRHLRIASIALFTVTLVKVFLYDLADLGTVSRTIVFVVLGVLLLTASYLYARFRTVIFGDGEQPS